MAPPITGYHIRVQETAETAEGASTCEGLAILHNDAIVASPEQK
jgi:hypothetical protein